MNDNKYIEIRQRTEELIRQAYLIWQSSNYAEHLEQLDEDPVFRLLMTAMAYQFRGIDSDIEFMKQEVVNDFAKVFIPYSVDRVRPTTVVVENSTADDVADVILDDTSVFEVHPSNIQFIPLLKTRVVGAKVEKTVRLDGRRWKMSVAFPEGITNLAGLTFAIKDLMFKDIALTVDNKEMPLIKPWNMYDLPFTDVFSYNVRMYNKTPIWNGMSVCLEYLAQQDLALFCIADSASEITFPEETKRLDFVVEFFGIDEDFVLDKNKIHLNVNILVNAKVNAVTLTQDMPIVKVSDNKEQQFMNLLAPWDDRMLSNQNVCVRRVEADRFNIGSLIRLLDCLVTKYHSDYYAFQLLRQQDGDTVIRNMDALLQKLRLMADNVQADQLNGVYLYIKDDNERTFKFTSSFDIRYLSSGGTLPEGALNAATTFSTPAGLDVSKVRQISNPVYGCDDMFGNADSELLASYYVSTSDRIVTPADIKLFCRYRIMADLSLDGNAISEISVTKQLSENSNVGYEILAKVVLANTSLVRKAVGDRLPRLECLIEKSIEVRSVNIYPVKVSIQFA